MAMGCVQQWGSGRSLAVLCLGVLCATASSVGAQPGKADPPSSLPEEIVRAWLASEPVDEVGWMGLDKYGRLSFDKEATGLTGAVPAFRISFWKDGWLAELPVPLVPFGLDLSGTRVTDAGLKELAGLKSLQSLNLWDTLVTDAGLKELGGLTSLQSLDLKSTRVTDAGLKELAGLKSLQRLYLYDTRVTDKGVAELRKALPGCNISY